jgi:K+-transporting ATPase ATPase A chain
MRHSIVIFIVMLVLMVSTILWSVYFDTLKPNPGLTSHVARTFEILNSSLPDGKLTVSVPAIPRLPVDQHLGNLEGKEMRFGSSAGATFAALTTDVTCGAVNAETDSLNPLAALSPMVGMWLNCIFGGKGVGMINMLMFVIIGIFLAGMMVGRSPEYLGKKIGGQEVKLVIIGLLIHPLMILLPVGLFAATTWGMNAVSNPGAHGFSQMLYQFSSASANNGSAFDGLGVTYGFYNNLNPAPEAIYWDIATGLVMIFSRFLPIIAMIAMAALLGAKKSTPFGMGTLRVDTVTFGVLLFGIIVIVGALLFLPVAVLGPVAEHFGPIPFGG